MTPTDLQEIQAYYWLEQYERDERDAWEEDARRAAEVNAAIQAALHAK